MAQPATPARLFRWGIPEVWRPLGSAPAALKLVLLALVSLICIAAELSSHAGPFPGRLSLNPALAFLLLLTFCGDPAMGLIPGYVRRWRCGFTQGCRRRSRPSPRWALRWRWR